jgi:BirA family biotin operon repressor/biotin-[acetyl-CoA-carboxylase] ligase
LQRTFFSPAQQGIYLSILLRPSIPLTETPFLTLCAAVAVCRALEETCAMRAGIKWVNDIFYEGKKLCGILTEAVVTAELQAVEYAVVGIGLNTGAVSPEVRQIATSVREATGLTGIRNRLIAAILDEFERVYGEFTQQGKKAEILADYSSRLFIVGRRVAVSDPKGDYEATVYGLDEEGGLLLQSDNGDILRLGAGEIHLIKE